VRVALEHSPTKERLLDAAERLMLAKGFSATTVDEICEASKLTKGSFFHYFQNKEELGRDVLERFCRRQQDRLMAAPFHQKRDPLERVEGMLEFMIQMSEEPGAPQGCLLGTFSQELSATYPQIRACCADQFQVWARRLQKDLDESKAKYAPRSSVDIRSLSEHFIAVLEGSLIVAKAKQDPKVVAESLRHLKRYIRGLFGK